MLRKKHAAKRMDMHIANITEEVESLNTARTHILDEHMETEELIEIINRFLGGLSDRDRDILSRDIGLWNPLKILPPDIRCQKGQLSRICCGIKGN